MLHKCDVFTVSIHKTQIYMKECNNMQNELNQLGR